MAEENKNPENLRLERIVDIEELKERILKSDKNQALNIMARKYLLNSKEKGIILGRLYCESGILNLYTMVYSDEKLIPINSSFDKLYEVIKEPNK